MNLSIQDNEKIIEHLYKGIEEYSIERYPLEHRHHLGASVIGEECSRKLWYAFRWCKLEWFDARMRRLFQRGHNEEEKFQVFLYWVGVHTRSIDPKTSIQYKYSAVNGHYGGSIDAIGILTWANNLEVVLEYKTHNNKSFEDLKINKLIKSKPKHYAQMSGYGKGFNVKHGLYCAVNKDNDELYFELVELNIDYANELEKKAANIIYAKDPPLKISLQPTYYKCKYCTFLDICHHGVPIEKNCRSCKMLEPVEDGKWFCNQWQNKVPKDFLPKGCDKWIGIV